MCINWNEPQAAAYITHAAFERSLSTSWWMQTESAYKVRLGPATRSAVVTC